MKVRMGFVGNSSSTSFCIFGILLTDKEKEAIVKKAKDKLSKIEIDKIISNRGGNYEEDKQYIDGDIVSQYFDKLDVSITLVEGSTYPDDVHVGNYFVRMNRDETRGHFEDKVINEIETFIGKEASKRCEVIEEAWRDG